MRMLLLSCDAKKSAGFIKASQLLKYFIFVALLMNAAEPLHAQTKPVYTVSFEAALAKGGSDKSSLYFFSNGVSFKNISAGIGVGLDNYAIRSLPLFADVKKQFGHRKIKPFVGVSAGVNFQHPTSEQKREYNYFYSAQDFKNGFFTKASVGISMPVYHKLRLFMNAGYSYKTTSVKDIYRPNIGPSSITTDTYHFNRWFASIGFCF